MKPPSLLYAGGIILLLLSLCPQLLAQVGNDNPTGPSGQFNGNVTTGGSYDPYTGNAMRSVTDLVVAGAVGQYGLSYTRTWNSRAAGGWASNYDWRLDDVIDLPAGQVIPYTVSFPDGRVETFGPPYSGGGYHASPGTRERMSPLVGNLCYLLLTDGGKVEFTARIESSTEYSDRPPTTYNTYFFTPTALIDPYGQRTTLSFNGDGTINRVTEPAGRYLQFNYSGGHLASVVASNGPSAVYTFTTAAMAPMAGATTPYTMLTKVRYFSDGQYDANYDANYTYVKPNVGSVNGFPLLKTCQDTMYPGPMKNIIYVYAAGNNADGTPVVYGQIRSENSSVTGLPVSTLTVTSSYQRTETRGDGASRTFTYANGLLLSSTDFEGVSSSQTYDSNGYLKSVTDRRGTTTNFVSDPITGNVTLVTLPLTNSDTVRPTVRTVYGYAGCPDPNNRDGNNPYYVYSVTNERGYTTTYLRDTRKRVTRINNPDGGYETFTYDDTRFGQVKTHRLASGATITYNYGSTSLLVNWYPSATPSDPTPSAHPTVYTYDTKDRLFTVKDPRSKITTFLYNDRGQITDVQHPDADQSHDVYTYKPDGPLQSQTTPITPGVVATTSYTYDDYRRVKTVTSPGNGNSPLPKTQYFYGTDNNGLDDYSHTDANVTRAVLPSGNVIKKVYDGNKRLLTATAGYGSGDAATTTYSYDANGNLATTKSPNGPQWTYNYDARNRVKNALDPIGDTVDYLYDPAGNKVSEQRANNQFVTYDSYDEMNRLTQMTVEQAPTADAVTQYSWTEGGKIATMTDPGGKVYSYAYDGLNRLITTTYPLDSYGVKRTEARAYDWSGNLATFKNRGGATQTFTYDGRNRETLYHWSNGVPQDRTLVYDDASRVKNCNTTNTFVTFNYNKDGSLSSQEAWATGSYGDGVHRTLSYTYKPDGPRASMSYPGLATALSYAYTARDQLASMSLGGTAVVAYTYDDNGNPLTRKLGTLAKGSNMTFDAMNRVKHIEHTFGTNDIRSFDYGYDSGGRRQYMQRDGDKADGFGYGQSEQIYDFRVGGTVNVATGAVTGGILTYYDFDKRGNRTGVTVNGALTNYTTANDLNQYPKVGAQTAGYDWNGNLNTYNGWTYVYDGLNRLTSASAVGKSATYYYDGLNRQVKRVVDTVTTYSIWDGWNLAAEYGPSSALLNRYFYGAGGDLVKNDAKGQFYYADAQGSSSFVANSTGLLQEQYTYDLYGKPNYFNAAGTPLSGGSALGVDMLFTGQKWYSGYGILDLRNRAYFVSLGRFLQPDPIGFGGDGANIYRYCGNSPSNLSDPSGLGPLDLLKDLWRTINGTVPGTATTERIIVTGQDIPDSSAETAGSYPVGPAGPLDYAPNNGGASGGDGGGSGGGPDNKRDSKMEEKKKESFADCLTRHAQEAYGDTVVGLSDNLGYYGISAAAVSIASNLATSGVQTLAQSFIRDAPSTGLRQGGSLAERAFANDRAVAIATRVAAGRAVLGVVSKISGVVGIGATAISLGARAAFISECQAATGR